MTTFSSLTTSAGVDASLRFEPMGPDVFGAASPQALLGAIHEDGEALHDLVGQHVISIQPFQPETLLQLFRLAAKFESNPDRYTAHNTPLKGKILINAFYEPSTRTRLSFDSCLLYTSPSPRDQRGSRMPSSA